MKPVNKSIELDLLPALLFQVTSSSLTWTIWQPGSVCGSSSTTGETLPEGALLGERGLETEGEFSSTEDH